MTRNKRVVFKFIFFAYCALILWLTLFKREVRTSRKIVLDLFWAFRSWSTGGKNGYTESIQYFNNILLFVPFGFLFPWKDKGVKVLLISSVLMAILIEALQYIFMLGWCELDDVVSNTIGALIGYGAFVGLRRLSGSKS